MSDAGKQPGRRRPSSRQKLLFEQAFGPGDESPADPPDPTPGNRSGAVPDGVPSDGPDKPRVVPAEARSGEPDPRSTDGGERLPNLIIRASAGTGKTFQLSNRLLQLLLRGTPVDRILATTFTRKAAGEILDRVLTRIASAALDSGQRRELQTFLQLDALSEEDCLQLTAELLANLHRLRICTLDAFFVQVARGFSLELKFSPQWRIMDEIEETALRNEALKQVLATGETQNLLSLVHLLSKGEVKRAVSEVLRSTVNSSFALYGDSRPAAWSQLTRSEGLAAAELENLCRELGECELGKRMSRARDDNLEAALAGDWETFLEKGLANSVATMPEPTYYGKPIPEDAVAIFRQLIVQARASLVGRIANQTEGSFQLLKTFDIALLEMKQASRLRSFDDVTQALAELAEASSAEQQDARQVAFRLDGAIRHLLLDEFQDTSPVQWRALASLARESTRSQRGSFFCVGDTKQAIYGWRGGEAAILEGLDQQLQNVATSTLSQSFRSSPAVIETVNRVFEEMPDHNGLDHLDSSVKAWSRRFPVHSTHKQELPGFACLQTAEEPGAVEVLRHAARLTKELREQAPGRTIGILARTNDTVAQLISELRHLDIDASEEGGNPLTDSRAVQLVLSALRLADHPGDLVCRYHVLHSPLAATLGLSELYDNEQAQSVAHQLRRQILADGYGSVVSNLAESLKGKVPPREQQRLGQLVELAYQYQARVTLRTADFLRFVEKRKVSDPTSAKVRVMTIHQSKGLEFDIVILPELDQELVGKPAAFVFHRSEPTAAVDRICRYVNVKLQELLSQEMQLLFEERTSRAVEASLCNLYVALTRAVHGLYMVIQPSRQSEKRLPKKTSGLLRAALTDGTAAMPNQTLYTAGDPEWYRRLEDSSRPLAAGTSQPPPGSRPVLAKSKRKVRGLERVQPSGLEGGGKVALADLLDTGNSQALFHGTLIHAWLEHVQWLEDGRPDRDLLCRTAQRLALNSHQPLPDLERLLANFEEMVAASAIRETLQRDFYRQAGGLTLPDAPTPDHPDVDRLAVRNEFAFAVRESDRLVAGTIDRLVVLLSQGRVVAADIVDFKTDRFQNEHQLQAKVAHYRPQLAAYRQAVSQLMRIPLEQVQTRLLFVSGGRHVPLLHT